MKNEKNYLGFRIPKLWQIVKHFAMSFHQAECNEEKIHFFSYNIVSKNIRENIYFHLINFYEKS